MNGTTGFERATNVSSALFTPIASTMSSVFLIPAVSATMTGRPPMSRDSSSTSRVVPGTWVTIAASRWAVKKLFVNTKSPVTDIAKRSRDEVPRKLSSDDFPALGGPKMASRMPDLSISPRRLSDRMR